MKKIITATAIAAAMFSTGAMAKQDPFINANGQPNCETMSKVLQVAYTAKQNGQPKEEAKKEAHEEIDTEYGKVLDGLIDNGYRASNKMSIINMATQACAQANKAFMEGYTEARNQ